ncbi:MAG: hypothetical protein WKG00_13045 [Polyangiaceae bacterium]
MLEPFETELSRLVDDVVRDLTREITALILRRLGVEAPGPAARVALGGGAGSAPRGPGRPAGRTAPPPSPRAASSTAARSPGGGSPGPGRRARSTSEDKAVTLAQVESALAASSGLSASELEKKTGLGRAALTAALKALKDDGRVFMGGNRRFARYATSQAVADRASADARGA